MNHTEKCIADQLAHEREYNEWITLWPNYCSVCGGEGVTYYDDCVTVDPYPMYFPCSEPCGACLDMGKCPRCGEHSIEWYDENPFCRSCGWMDFGPDGYRSAAGPPPYECYCWEDRLVETEQDIADYLALELGMPYRRVYRPDGIFTPKIAECPNDKDWPKHPESEDPPINCEHCPVANQCPYPEEPPMPLDLGTEVEL